MDTYEMVGLGLRLAAFVIFWSVAERRLSESDTLSETDPKDLLNALIYAAVGIGCLTWSS